jgi:hypothetical protein
VKGATVQVVYGKQTAEVAINVWIPTGTWITTDDDVLQNLVPSNVPEPPAGCVGRYQSTNLYAYANYTNGGTQPTDKLSAVDISYITSYSASNPSSIQIDGSTATGMSPSPSNSSVSLTAFNVIAAAKLSVVVVEDRVCIEAVTAIAFTKVVLVTDNLAPVLGEEFRVTATAEQVLNSVGSVAYVETLATLSDGVMMDATHFTTIVARPVAAAAPFKFSLSVDVVTTLPMLTVNGTTDGPICGNLLEAQWDVCDESFPLSYGTGFVAINVTQQQEPADATRRLHMTAETDRLAEKDRIEELERLRIGLIEEAEAGIVGPARHRKLGR